MLPSLNIDVNNGNDHLEKKKKKEMHLGFATGQELRTILRKDIGTWKGEREGKVGNS